MASNFARLREQNKRIERERDEMYRRIQEMEASKIQNLHLMILQKESI